MTQEEKNKSMGSKVLAWTGRLFSKNRLEEALGRKVLPRGEDAALEALWNGIIEGAAPWNNRETPSLMLAPKLCDIAADKVVIEMEAAVSAKASDKASLRAAFLDVQLQRFLEDARLAVQLLNRRGRLLLKPYVKGNQIHVRVCSCEEYVPLACNEKGALRSVLFQDRFCSGGRVYTLFEIHEYDEGTFEASINYLGFVSKTGGELGVRVPLSEVEAWAELQDCYSFGGIKSPLFVELVWDGGRPLFHPAIKALEQADRQYANILNEYKVGKAKIFASQELFRRRRDGSLDLKIPDESTYIKLDSEASDLLSPYLPELRDAALWQGLNEMKRLIEFNVGLSYGTLSDLNDQARTATELIMNKQNTMIIVGLQQRILRKGLQALCTAMDCLASLYGLVPAGSWALSVNFGDGIKEDWNDTFARRLRLVEGGFVDASFVVSEEFSVTAEQAACMLPKAADGRAS